MDCSTCQFAGTSEHLLSTLQDERRSITRLLREQTAQTFSAILMEIAGLLQIREVAAIHQRLAVLRGELRPELERIQAHVAEVDHRWKVSCKLSPDRPCEVIPAD